MEFKDRLRELRKEKRITQEMLGREIHVSRSLVAKWEAGLGVPNEDLLDALCLYFGVEQKQLLPDATTEEVFVDKNLKIRKGKRLSIVLASIILSLVTIGSCLGVYKGMEIARHRAEVEIIKTLVPTVQKLYFENPKIINVEDEVPIEDGKYIIEERKWTKVYFEIDVDERICNSWYSFTVEFNGFDTIGLRELSYRQIEGSTLNRFCCFAYIRPQAKEVTQLSLKKVSYFYTIDGEGWTVDCENVSKSIPVSVKKGE